MRAGWWAQRAARRVRRDLATGSLDHLAVLPPPPLPGACRPRVVKVLGLRRDTCLVRAAVLQEWDLVHGRPRDLVIGVTAPGSGFQAHAWLDGDPPAATGGFDEFTRRPPRARAAPQSGEHMAGGAPQTGGHSARPASGLRRSARAGRPQPVKQEGKVGPGS